MSVYNTWQWVQLNVKSECKIKCIKCFVALKKDNVQFLWKS